MAKRGRVFYRQDYFTGKVVYGTTLLAAPLRNFVTALDVEDHANADTAVPLQTAVRV